jgi:hypothetical protein
MILLVDDDDLNWEPSDALGGGESTETGSHDYHPGLSLVVYRL